MRLLSISGLEKSYAGRQALCGIDMELHSGQITGLLGPNSSGKTTLLKTIAGLLQPDRGEIIYPDGARRGIPAKQSVSFLPDGMLMPAWMRVKDAFQYYADLYPDYREQKAREMIELLELPQNVPLKKLSKGMQERVFLGLAFSRETALYLLDEPLGGIDPLGKSKILESILSMQLENAAILLSTHLVKDVETIFDNVYMISQGKIVYHGESEAIREESGKTVEQIYLEVFSRVTSA